MHGPDLKHCWKLPALVKQHTPYKILLIPRSLSQFAIGTRDRGVSQNTKFAIGAGVVLVVLVLVLTNGRISVCKGMLSRRECLQ